MTERYDISELDSAQDLLELVDAGECACFVTVDGKDRIVAMPAANYEETLGENARMRRELIDAQAALELAKAARLEDAATVLGGAGTDTADADAAAKARRSTAPTIKGSGEEYVLAQLPNTPIASDDYSRSSYQGAIADRMRKVIEAEAPVEKQRLFNTVRASFGIKRSGRDVQEHNDWIYRRQIEAQETEFNGSTFVWRPDQDPAEYKSYRIADEESGRQITEIPYEELKAAILDALSQAEALSRDELMELAMRLLGYKRKTNRMKDVLGAAIEQASQEGTIQIQPDGTFIAN